MWSVKGKLGNANRPRRANDLARAITNWNEAKTNRSFSVAVWGIGVDAAFGNTVFVPTSFDTNGSVKAMGPTDENGNRIYVCYIDIPNKPEHGCTACTELSLPAFLLTALGDEKMVGIAIHLGEVRFTVGREILVELARKIGLAGV